LESTKTVWVPAYRIDEVEGLRVVEVEEFQEYQEVEHIVGERLIVEELRELEVNKLGRQFGKEHYPEFADELGGLKVDSYNRDYPDPIKLDLRSKYYEVFEGTFPGEDPSLVIGELDLHDDKFKLTNVSNREIRLDDWIVKAEHSGREFVFQQTAPGRRLGPGQSVFVYSGPGSDRKFDYSREKIFWTSEKIWNSAGDKASLRKIAGTGEELHWLHSLNVSDGFHVATCYKSGEGSSRTPGVAMSPREKITLEVDDFPRSRMASPREKNPKTLTPVRPRR